MILVVDDDERVLSAAAELFKELGYEITTAKDGRSALDIFVQGRFRLILVDALLPKLSGPDLIKEILATRKGSQAVCLLFSGIYKQASVQAEMQKKSGAMGFVTKPLTPQMCSALLQEHGARLKAVTSEGMDRAAAGPLLIPAVTGVVDAQPMTVQKMEEYLKKGNLDGRSAFGVIWLISRLKMTGVLSFSQGSDKFGIHFDKGLISHIDGTNHTLLFGQILVAQGFIKEEELEQTIHTLDPEQKLGNTLVDRALISPHVIDEIVYFQQFERLAGLCDWNLDRFDFSNQPPKHGLEYDFTLFDLLYEITFTRTSFDALQKWYKLKLKTLEIIWIPDSECLKNWKPEPAVAAILQTVHDQKQSVETWLKRHKGKEELALRLLRFLHTLDMVRFMEHGVEARTIAKIQALFQEYLAMDFFERLGVTKWTTPEEVKERFRALSKDFHPDMRPPEDSVAVKQEYSKVFELINEAYDALKDRDNIERYRKFGRLITNEDIAMADDSFKKGQREFARKNYGAARQYFERSYQLNPESGAYLANLCWAQLFLINKSTPGYDQAMERILADIQKAREMSPESVAPLMVLGNFYKITNQLEKAARAFQDAQNVDPDNKDAQRELRLMVMRESKSDKGGKTIFGIKIS